MSRDDGHVDPYVRCCECQRMEDTVTISKRGSCLCGSKRFRPLTFLLNQKEYDRIEATHPEYLKAEFEKCEEDD